VEERRATSRYNLALPVEIRLAPHLTAVGSIFAKTRDISTHGFYFNIAQEFMLGTKFEFSITLPIEVIGATQAYVSGKARVVRVEEPGESHPDHSGVGALIESYQISRAESVKP
jgi:PilZ domain